MSEQKTAAALANDIERFLKFHKDGESYHYFDQINTMPARNTAKLLIRQYELPDGLVKECNNTPTEFIQAAKEATLSIMREIHPDYEQELRETIQIQITDVEPTPMKLVLSEHINKLVAIEGKVIAIGDTEPVLVKAAYRCTNCNTVTEGRNGKEPKKCVACSERVLELDEETTTFTDQQVIKLQELTSGGRGKVTTLSVIKNGRDSLWTEKAGEKIKATGIHRVTPFVDQRFKRVKFLKHLEALGIEKKESDITITPQDIQRIKAMSEEPQFYEKLRDSFAPHLYGIEEVKEACILALGSQGLERPINLLLAGDPDTGKSEAMKYAVALSHNGHKTDMAPSSAVGLTVESAYDEDTKTRLASPGLLNFADGGLAGIDEFQSINKDDAGKLNGALEEKEIESHKAGVHEKLPAKCALIVTTNSEFGKWNTAENIYTNLKFLGKSTPMLVSRFDLIYILLDKKHPETDAKKANMVISTYSKTETPKNLFMEDTPDRYGFVTMQKYFAYIAKTKLPEVPDELTDKIRETWLKAREEDSRGVVGNRNLKSIIRLARIIARLLQKEYVDLADLTRARELIDKSLDTSAFDPRAGEIDPNLAYGATKTTREVKQEMNQEEAFLKAYTEAAADYEDGKPEELKIVVCLMTKPGWTEDRARKFTHKRLRDNNAIPYFTEPKSDRWEKH